MMRAKTGKPRRVLAGGMRSRRGSASALIVLMVVLLAVFGAMALATAAANLRLAHRHADWSKEYYGYDASAERLMEAIDWTARESRDSGQTAATLIGRLGAIRMDGVASIVCERSGERLVVDATVGDPENRGILVSIAVPIDADGKIGTEGLQVLRWSQFQKAFEYGTGPGGIWTGGK